MIVVEPQRQPLTTHLFNLTLPFEAVGEEEVVALEIKRMQEVEEDVINPLVPTTLVIYVELLVIIQIAVRNYLMQRMHS
jgi:hypothetical protein